jgi:uncharacterized ion transporter superfamily protein YfcC
MKSGFKFPQAYTILFALIVVVAAATWFVPAGKYDRTLNETLGREVPVAGTYKQVESNPQGPVDVFMAPVKGFYDPVTYLANAIDVALFVLVIGGYLGVVTKTGAIDAGIARVTAALRGREVLLIPLLMLLFAIGGTTYGMAEESLAFYTIVIPVLIAARFDALTGVAVIMLGAGIGVLGSTVNAFATVIASNAAGIAFTQGLALRLVILVVGWGLCVAYVMRYALKVKADPSASLVADRAEENREHFLRGKNFDDAPPFTVTQQIVLVLFAASFVIMVVGVSMLGWYMAEMTAMFLAFAVAVGIIARLGEGVFCDTFVNGARDLLGVALVIGLARGIVVIMDAGNITDTILFWSEQAVSGLSGGAFITVMYFIEVALSFFVPSSSGLAVLTMPIMAPLGDFSGVDRDLVVTAYQSANGWLNLFNPTFAVVMGGLAIGRVPYDRWLRFVWPLLLVLTVVIVAALYVSA